MSLCKSLRRATRMSLFLRRGCVYLLSLVKTLQTIVMLGANESLGKTRDADETICFRLLNECFIISFVKWKQGLLNELIMKFASSSFATERNTQRERVGQGCMESLWLEIGIAVKRANLLVQSLNSLRSIHLGFFVLMRIHLCFLMLMKGWSRSATNWEVISYRSADCRKRKFLWLFNAVATERILRFFSSVLSSEIRLEPYDPFCKERVQSYYRQASINFSTNKQNGGSNLQETYRTLVGNHDFWM